MTDIKSPDVIMAEYLLKGGKMLSKTCPVCHSPLFEYKGKTLCVVCEEEKAAASQKTPSTTSPPSLGSATGFAPQEFIAPGGLEDEFALTLRALLVQAREERDSTRIVTLMESVRKGAEAYALLLYGYGRRDNS
ncbi:MAG TPA: autoantigen p27 domain-containing protein [Methanospirillum sp.]|uniref:autoantigen p27 domain-containing protein n=1 Tax=Methanospirillum sp. TaxID=45200 RepID=UPI002CFA46FF|nr:autoantigen p27 domain-containing protein [Methanospirillum sp.]HOJ95754.1 autoantigen p27 domain-containing protein [Methanospirillum sp.]HOL40775.1 autoantigen p27 domain-containing protein [Methanospirillum sp.]HPP79002.1 autoantigen p27 domain-containing protein [Methanospirillum sp.]